MKTLIIKDLYKHFPIGKNNFFTALNNINLSFDSIGFNAIVGRSGSGKTTLLNMISRFDKPSRGEIYLNGEKYNYKNKKQYKFFRNDVGIISQQYNLIDNLSVIENVMTPLLINGCSRSKAKKLAIETLQYVNLPQELYDNKCSNLSGGEAQRVAIARILVRKPKIILCDEPTGALDSINSTIVMNLLSKISKEYLVIMVSHNLQIVEQYCDRIIEISEGRITKDSKNKKTESSYLKKNEIIKGHTGWTGRFSYKNFTRRFKRNLFIIASLSISMIITNLMVGFISGKDEAIKIACYQQLDFGSGAVSKDEVVSNTGIIKLTKSVRPSLSELKTNTKISENFHISPNFSAILPSNIKIYHQDSLIENISYTPIYSYDDDHIDHNLLSLGKFPETDSIKEVVINQLAYQLLVNSYHIDPLIDELQIKHKFESIYVNEYEENITDYFELNTSFKVVGVINELSYLNTPKIYYSYLALENYTQEYQLLNLSTYYDYKITWYDRVMNAEDYSIISAYSYFLFLKDYRYREKLFDVSIFADYSFNSTSLIISNSLIGFLAAGEYALILFLAIGIIGTLLILSIISFTNYSEDRKISAILTSLGARNSDIESIYVNENLYSGFISLLLSFVISYPLSILVNHLIDKYLSIKGIVQIPYLSFKGVPFFYPLILLTSLILLVYIATILPIRFSKRQSLSLELKVND